MFSVILGFGLVIFLGIAFILVKLPRKYSLWLLGHSVLLDIGVTVLTLAVHWGTMTGVMAATMAGLMCALATGIGRKAFGYIRNGVYTRGWFRVYL